MNETIKERRIESLIKHIHERNRGCIIEISLNKAPQVSGYYAIYDELERIERGVTYNIQKTLQGLKSHYQLKCPIFVWMIDRSVAKVLDKIIRDVRVESMKNWLPERMNQITLN